MDINFDAWMPYIYLLLGVGVIWLVASVVLKLAKTVVSIGCSLLIVIALVILAINIF